jgi:hypothetical protein
MVTWLRTFDMESRLLGQLVELKRGVAASIGKGLFAGEGAHACCHPTLCDCGVWCGVVAAAAG